jgi:hypothetical protein
MKGEGGACNLRQTPWPAGDSWPRSRRALPTCRRCGCTTCATVPRLTKKPVPPAAMPAAVPVGFQKSACTS